MPWWLREWRNLMWPWTVRRAPTQPLRDAESRPDDRPPWWPIVVGPLGLVAAAAVAALLLIQPYEDAATRLAIVAVVATVAGLLLAAAGLAFGLRQLQLLQRDQRRIADTLAIQPDVHGGFKHSGRPPKSPHDLPQSLTIKPVWTPGQNYSEPYLVEVEVHNFGNGSAQQVLTTVTLPSGLRVSDVEHEHPFVLKEGESMWISASKEEFLHPSASIVVPCRMGFPVGTDGVNFSLAFGVRDRAAVRVRLRIDIEPPG
jgi:hypothetical protein